MSNIHYANVGPTSAQQIINAATEALAKAGFKAVVETKHVAGPYSDHHHTEIRVLFGQSDNKNLNALIGKVAAARANVDKLKAECNLAEGEFAWMDLPENDNPLARFDGTGNVVMTISTRNSVKDRPIDSVSYSIWNVSYRASSKGVQNTSVQSHGEVTRHRSREINPESTAKRLVKITKDQIDSLGYDFITATQQTANCVRTDREARVTQNNAQQVYKAKLDSLSAGLPFIISTGVTKAYSSITKARITIDLDYTKLMEFVGKDKNAYLSDGEILDAIIAARAAAKVA